MAGLYVGLTVVALLRFVTSRERRLIPAAILFALLAAIHTEGLEPRWTTAAHWGAALAGLALVLRFPPPRPGDRRL
jgi:hypothetical protein